MYDGHCAYCGCKITLKQMQVDHIVPLSRGGTDTTDNMYPACRSCNHYKHTLDIETFRRYIERMPQTLKRDSVTYNNAVRFGLVIPNPHEVKFYFEQVQEQEEHSPLYNNIVESLQQAIDYASGDTSKARVETITIDDIEEDEI